MTITPTFKDRLAKAVGYDSDDRDRDDDVPSISNADLFIEYEPTVGEFLADITPSGDDVARYVSRLFPFIQWIGKYNWTWFIGDLIAGKRKTIEWTSKIRDTAMPDSSQTRNC